MSYMLKVCKLFDLCIDFCSQGDKTFLSLSNPRCLGPALTKGAVYVGSSQDTTSTVTCFKGNMQTSLTAETSVPKQPIGRVPVAMTTT